MVSRGLRDLCVVALVIPLACGGTSETTDSELAGSGGAGGASGSKAGAGGSTSAGGAAGRTGSGGSGGGAGRSGGGGAGGKSSPGGSGGVAGTTASAGKGGATSAGSGGDSGSSAEGGEGGAPDGDGLSWSESGFISATGNAFGIQGSWFFETDCADATQKALPCTLPEPALTGPDMLPGWTVTREEVCAKGTAPQVVMEEYAAQWGARLGFELNLSQPFDAEAQGVRGFTFDIRSTAIAAPATLRLTYSTPETTTLAEHFVEVVLPATNASVLFAEALQGVWVNTVVPLDTARLTEVAFMVTTNVTAPKPFEFCVSNVRVVR